jgi:hypothetical protein
MSLTMVLRCSKHPRYMGKFPPRVVNCVTGWVQRDGCECPGIWTIAQWMRGAEYPNAARQPIVRVRRSLLSNPP